MKKLAVILGLVVLVPLISLGWQIGSCELTHIEFEDDLHDLSAQVGTHIGLPQPSTDDELRAAIIDYAKKYGIQLDTTRITVRRTGPSDFQTAYLAASYQQVIRLPGYSFTLDFTATSAKKSPDS